MTDTPETDLHARALVLLAALGPLKPHRSGTPLFIGADSIRWQAFKRDARADLWLTGPQEGFQLHFTVRDKTPLGAVEALADLVDKALGGGA